jgi:hypothetical protein
MSTRRACLKSIGGGLAALATTQGESPVLAAEVQS